MLCVYWKGGGVGGKIKWIGLYATFLHIQAKLGPSRHRIRYLNPGGLRPSTLPFGHGGSPQYCVLRVDGEENFLFFFKPPRPGTEPRTPAWKAAVLTTTLGPTPAREGGGGGRWTKNTPILVCCTYFHVVFVWQEWSSSSGSSVVVRMF